MKLRQIKWSFESGSASDEGKEQVTVNDQDGNELNTETSASLLSTDYIPNGIPTASLSIMSGTGIYNMCDTGSVKIEAEYTSSTSSQNIASV